jgi:hypothetical protein
VIWSLLAFHVFASGVVLAIGRLLGRRALLVAALPPAVTAG